jgi:hypothetical protein
MRPYDRRGTGETESVDAHRAVASFARSKGGQCIMFVRKRLAPLGATAVALAIGVPVGSASAATPPGQGWSPGPILPPNAQCPLWRGLNIVPVGCVPWSVIIWDQLHGRPF